MMNHKHSRCALAIHNAYTQWRANGNRLLPVSVVSLC